MRIASIASLIFAVIAALQVSEAAAAGQYRLVDLNLFHPSDINNAGQITGSQFASPFNLDYFGLLMPNQYDAESIDLGTQNPGDSTGGKLNSVGQVASRYLQVWTPTTPNGAVGTTSWAPLPGAILGDLENPTIVDIGDDGTLLIAGWHFPTGQGRSFVWKPSVPNGATGVTATWISTGVSAVNNKGHILGNDSNGRFLFIPTTPGSIDGIRHSLNYEGGAREMNDNGQIVGQILVGDRLHATFWNPAVPNGTSGTTLDLGLLPGRLQSYSIDVNNHGVVVGTANDNSPTSSSQARLQNGLAFQWTSGGGMQSLTNLLDASGAGWQLYSATGINDLGQIIGVGMYDPDGPGGVAAEARGFVLNPSSRADDVGAGLEQRHLLLNGAIAAAAEIATERFR
jgi:hypothetical protein